MNQHIAKQFDAELEAVRALVLQMGGLVEQQITSAIEVLSTGNLEQCDRIIHADHRVNGLEIEIDEQCSHIIARRQPTAIDLRMILTVIKTITDLERIGDHAKNMSEYVVYLIKGKDVRHVSAEQLERVVEQ